MTIKKLKGKSYDKISDWSNLRLYNYCIRKKLFRNNSEDFNWYNNKDGRKFLINLVKSYIY